MDNFVDFFGPELVDKCKAYSNDVLRTYFQEHKDVVAIKVYVEVNPSAGPLDSFIISRYDQSFNKSDYTSTYGVELDTMPGIAVFSIYGNAVKINTETAIIKDIKSLKKVDLTSEELWYVFNRPTGANTVFDDTNDFQVFYGLKGASDKAQFISQDKMEMKIGHMHEELDELVKSYKEGNFAECADAIIDLIYVASGLGNLLNLPMVALWRDVQNSNMVGKERVKSLDAATKRGTTFDVRKTKDWIGPRGKEIIDEYNKRFS